MIPIINSIANYFIFHFKGWKLVPAIIDLHYVIILTPYLQIITVVYCTFIDAPFIISRQVKMSVLHFWHASYHHLWLFLLHLSLDLVETKFTENAYHDGIQIHGECLYIYREQLTIFFYCFALDLSHSRCSSFMMKRNEIHVFVCCHACSYVRVCLFVCLSFFCSVYCLKSILIPV